MQFHRVDLLAKQVERDFDFQGFALWNVSLPCLSLMPFPRYFAMDASGKVLTYQNGVFRTNCMDCLDRTNVTQSMFARKVLNRQLQQLGIISLSETVDNFPEFLQLFRNIWADNADVISIHYSGTGALKTDYTRYEGVSSEGVRMN